MTGMRLKKGRPLIITHELAVKMQHLESKGFTRKELAEKFGVHRNTVRNAINRLGSKS